MKGDIAADPLVHGQRFRDGLDVVCDRGAKLFHRCAVVGVSGEIVRVEESLSVSLTP